MGSGRLRLPHHRHDLGVAGIGRDAGRADGQGRIAVHRAREDGGAVRLGDLERLAGQVGLVHDPVPGDDDAVDRADVVRVELEHVADGHVPQGDVDGRRAPPPVGDRRDALGQGGQHGRRAPQRVGLQRLPAGQHQDDDCTRQVLAEEDRGDDGDPAEQVGPEVQLQEFSREVVEERESADDQGHEERGLERGRGGAEREAEQEVGRDGDQRDRRDDRALAPPEGEQLVVVPVRGRRR